VKGGGHVSRTYMDPPVPRLLRCGQAPRAVCPQPTVRPHAGRILVVDDESAIREVIIQLLEDEGYLVEQAANGVEALTKLQLIRPDVIVLDLMMPVMDGWAFAKTCHALDIGEAIPILVTSATPQDGIDTRR